MKVMKELRSNLRWLLFATFSVLLGFACDGGELIPIRVSAAATPLDCSAFAPCGPDDKLNSIYCANLGEACIQLGCGDAKARCVPPDQSQYVCEWVCAAAGCKNESPAIWPTIVRCN